MFDYTLKKLFVFLKIKDTIPEQHILPTFVKGEKGSHEPSFLEKETTLSRE